MAKINHKVFVPEGYNPMNDKHYMSDVMLEYFNNILLHWKKEILETEEKILKDFEKLNIRESDHIDEGIVQEIRIEESSLLEHDIKLVKLIDYALNKIDSGEYGYCEKTGEEIGIPRLMAWPIATLCIQAQEEIERKRA